MATILVLTKCSSFLARPSANFAKRIQELADDKAENKSVQTPTRKIKSQSFVLLNSFPYRNRPYSKNVGRRSSPLGASIRRPTRDGPGLLVLPSPSPWTKFLTQRFWETVSCLPPPKSSPSSPGRTPSSAAICGAGASWRLLGRKNRVPRGLQKLIKF